MALKATNDHLIELMTELAVAKKSLEIFIIMTPGHPPYVVNDLEYIELPYADTPGGMVIDVRNKRYATRITADRGFREVNWKRIITWL